MGYPSDAKDAEWDVISPLLPKAKPGGRPRTTPLREVVNAIFYISRGGCAWRMLPKDFPPYQTVYRYFRVWSKDGTVPGRGFMMPCEIANARRWGVRRAPVQLRSIARAPKRRERGLQRVRCWEERQGRKRHLVVDTLGLILDLVVHPADVQDRDGAKLVLEKLADRFPRLKGIWADGAYAGKLVDWAKKFGSWGVGDRQEIGRCEGFLASASSLGCREGLCLAGPFSSVE